MYVSRFARSYYVWKSSILLALTGVKKISSVARGFSSFKIQFSDLPKSLISRIIKFMFFQLIFAIIAIFD